MIGMICIQENRKTISVTHIWFALKCQWNLIFWSSRISLFVSRIRFLIPHISEQSYTNYRFPLYSTYIRRSQNLHPKIEKTSQQVFTTLFFNPIDDVGGRGVVQGYQKDPLPVFLLQLLLTKELSSKPFDL